LQRVVALELLGLEGEVLCLLRPRKWNQKARYPQPLQKSK